MVLEPGEVQPNDDPPQELDTVQPDNPEPPSGDAKATPPDEPDTPAASDESSSSDDEESPEWDALSRKFNKIQDEKERRREIGKQYWEKTRFASETRKENERLRKENEDLRRAKSVQASPPDEPPSNPDLERLDHRLQVLEDRDKTLYTDEQRTLVDMGKLREQRAAAKAVLDRADESERASLEAKLDRLDDKQDQLQRRLSDIYDRRTDIEGEYRTIRNDRDKTARQLSQRRQEEKNERLDLEDFQRELPSEIGREIDRLADASGIDPEDETLRDDMKGVIKDRLTVRFWKLGQAEASDEAIAPMIEEEFDRYVRSRDLADRKKFGRQSKEKLSVAGKRPGSETQPPKGRGTPREPRPPVGYDAPPKDVTALGGQELSPSMKRGRDYLRQRGW